MGTGYTLQYDRTFYSITYVTDVSPVPVGTLLFELKIFVETLPVTLIIGIDQELRFDDDSTTRTVITNESPVILNITSGTSNDPSSPNGLLSGVKYSGIQITTFLGPTFSDTFQVNFDITITETTSNVIYILLIIN